jgi:hypothetical protein
MKMNPPGASLTDVDPDNSDDLLEDIPDDNPLASVAARLPEVTRLLDAAGVCYARIGYDGRGDIEKTTLDFFDAPQDPVSIRLPALALAELQVFFRQLLEARYPRWAAGEGASGYFAWDLICDALTHAHHVRYIEFETTYREGF